MFLVRTHPVARGKKIGSNQPPVWQSVPTPSFELGVASNFPSSGTYESNGYVTDEDGDALTLTWITGSVTGVTWDGDKFVYDGTGSAATTSGLVLRADDGVDVTDSSAFSIHIVSNLAWSSIPAPSFVEASASPSFNLGLYVLNYNATTDDFRVTPGVTLPSWLSLTGSNFVNLTPDGSQDTGDTFDNTPGITIDVRRSGGAWVTSSAFGVTVTAIPVVAGTIADFVFLGYKTHQNEVRTDAIGTTTNGTSTFGKHVTANWNPVNNNIYTWGGDGWVAGNNPPASSGCVRYHRFDHDGNQLADYYPYHGMADETGVLCHPIGSGLTPLIYDSSRQCYWTFGGFYEGYTNDYTAARERGRPVAQGMYRFDLTGANAGRWVEVLHQFDATQYVPGEGRGGGGLQPPNIQNVYGETNAGIYHPRTDTLLFASDRVRYIPLSGANAFTLQAGPVITGSGVALTAQPSAYDAVTDRLFGHDAVYTNGLPQSSIWVVDLSNFNTSGASSASRSALWTGLWKQTNGVLPVSGGSIPLFIRGRKVYVCVAQHNYNSANDITIFAGADNGLGFHEVDIDTGEHAQASYPSGVLKEVLINNNAPDKNFGGRNVKLAVYASSSDKVVMFPAAGSFAAPSDSPDIAICGWSMPTAWPPDARSNSRPASGDVRKIGAQLDGSVVNTLNSVQTSGVYDGNNVRWAWAGACFSPAFSTNGAMLFQWGGDADGWNNSVFCFDFDYRKWSRLSDPSTAMTGGNPATTPWVTDAARATTHPLYWNSVECEHGPKPEDSAGWLSTQTGLLPAGTQPGVPHLVDGMMWLPGSIIGNVRGALVRPSSNFCYAQASTGRAHYFDLDWVSNSFPRRYNGWGRLTTTRTSMNANYSATAAFDAEGLRLYHSNGYINLAATPKVHVFKSWNNFCWEVSGCFDPVRRLWLMPNIQGSDISTTPGSLRALPVDRTGVNGETFALLPHTGTLPQRGQMWQGGLKYCPDLDCFFFYNIGRQGTSTIYETRQKIWKIQPPTTTPVSDSNTTALTSNWTVTEITMPGDTVVAPTPSITPGMNGSYSTFQWIPAFKSFAFFSGLDVYLYRPEGV